MIFVTVGAQMPFDRLVEAVDSWADSHGGHEIFAQIGLSRYRPEHMRWCSFLSTQEFREKMLQTAVVVSHAGMGTILTALEYRKPLLVMPRRSELRETRNNHQVSTVRNLSREGLVQAAHDEVELREMLDRLDTMPKADPDYRHPSLELIRTIRSFIDGSTAAEVRR